MNLVGCESKRKVRILVVDDHEGVAATAAAILGEEGYDTATASGGEEAVAIAAGFRPQVLLADIRMPGMDGIDAATRIAMQWPQCQVLFLSGTASIRDVESLAPPQLIYSFVKKPIRPADLLAVVANMAAVAEHFGNAIEPAACNDIETSKMDSARDLFLNLQAAPAGMRRFDLQPGRRSRNFGCGSPTA